MSVFSEENEFSFHAHRQHVQRARKLIPRHSKVFPKDFFSNDNNNLNLPPKNEREGLSSPRVVLASIHNTKSRFSEPTIPSIETYQRNLENTNRSSWRQNRNVMQSNPNLLLEKPRQPRIVLKEIGNLNLEHKGALNQPTMMRKGGLSDDQRYEKAFNLRKKSFGHEINFISVTEADEDGYNQNISKRRRTLVDEELKKTPVFKHQESFPTIKENFYGKKLAFEDDKTKLSHLNIPITLESNLSLNSKQPFRRNRGYLEPFKESEVYNEQKITTRGETINLNIKVEISNLRFPQIKRGFLPSIGKS